MIDISTFNILLTLLFVLMPLFVFLAKDGAKLYRDIRDALKDGELSSAEIDLIIADTGVVLRSIVRLIEAVLLKLGKM